MIIENSGIIPVQPRGFFIQPTSWEIFHVNCDKSHRQIHSFLLKVRALNGLAY